MGKAAAFVAVVANPAIHVAHQPAHQREAKPLSAFLGGNEGFEHVFTHRRLYTGAIIGDAQLDR